MISGPRSHDLFVSFQKIWQICLWLTLYIENEFNFVEMFDKFKPKIQQKKKQKCQYKTFALTALGKNIVC